MQHHKAVHTRLPIGLHTAISCKMHAVSCIHAIRKRYHWVFPWVTTVGTIQVLSVCHSQFSCILSCSILSAKETLFCELLTMHAS